MPKICSIPDHRQYPGKNRRIHGKRRSVMAEDQLTLIKQFQSQFEKKVNETEISSLEYWKEQLDKLLTMKPEGINALQLQIKRVSNMMGNRINTLKRQ
jgi:hypothetical protein